jgi:L-malate glycosyltransferase
MRPLNIFVSHSSDLLTDCHPHGDGLIANGFIRALAGRGHNLHLAVGATKIQTALPNNVHIHQVITSPKLSLTARAQFILQSRRLFNRLHRIEPFDLIHQLNPVVTGLSTAMLGVGVPIVMGPYMPDWPLVLSDGSIGKPTLFKRISTLGKQFIVELQHRQADAVLLSTEAALAKVKSPDRMQSKLYLLPFGIDAEVFFPESRSSPPNILYLAGLHRNKGIFILLDAFKKINERFPDCRLRIAGKGWHEHEARRVATEMKSSQCIEFLGSVGRQDVKRLMNECSVFCLPSYAEAFGMAALEAMACGRPVVVTDAGGLAHVVSSEGGKKIPVGDPEQLASALIDILADPALGERMGKANRCMVEQVYAWPRVVERLEEIYYQVLQRQVGQARNFSSRGLPYTNV